MPSPHAEYPNLRIFDHPLIQSKLTRLRRAETPSDVFRRDLNHIAGLMTFEITRHLETDVIDIATPLERTTGVALTAPVTLVPILRAGLGMTEGILELIPEARVGHFGVYRDDATLRPVRYYSKFPPSIADGHAIVIDPMLATGGSASFAATCIKETGCTSLRMICLVCAPEGAARLLHDHDDVIIYAASLDASLDECGYIRPGLGDAGDRIFGTL